MTTLIAIATLGILALFGFCIWLGHHLAFRPPVDDPPPASWLAKMRGE